MNIGELLKELGFLAMAGLTVGGALGVVAFSNILYAALALFACLFGVAGLYALLGADFLAVIQLLIYAGGILVLIIFGVFLTSKVNGGKLELEKKRLPWMVGGVFGLGVFGLIARILSDAPFSTAVSDSAYVPTVKPIGDLLLTKYLLPFEVISVLLLFALVGAVELVRKELGGQK